MKSQFFLCGSLTHKFGHPIFKPKFEIQRVLNLPNALADELTVTGLLARPCPSREDYKSMHTPDLPAAADALAQGTMRLFHVTSRFYL
jgi:hypothetical protein